MTEIQNREEENRALLLKQKNWDNLIINSKRIIKDVLFIIAGILAAGFGLKSFLLPNKFIDGGATGISLLISQVSQISLSYLIILVNIPFIFLGIRVINKKFVFKTILAIIALAVVIEFIPFPHTTNDKLLISIFGGFFLVQVLDLR